MAIDRQKLQRLLDELGLEGGPPGGPAAALLHDPPRGVKWTLQAELLGGLLEQLVKRPRPGKGARAARLKDIKRGDTLARQLCQALDGLAALPARPREADPLIALRSQAEAVRWAVVHQRRLLDRELPEDWKPQALDAVPLVGALTDFFSARWEGRRRKLLPFLRGCLQLIGRADIAADHRIKAALKSYRERTPRKGRK